MSSGKSRDRKACPSCGVLITMPVSSLRSRFQCPRCLNIIALDTPETPPTRQDPGKTGPESAPESQPEAAPALAKADKSTDVRADGGIEARQMARQLENLGRECAELRRELADAKCALTDAAKMIAGIVILEQKITDLGWVCMTANSVSANPEEAADVIR
jgi:hypothetical protein